MGLYIDESLEEQVKFTVLAFAAMLLGQAAEALYSACAFLRRLTCLRH